MCIPVGVFYIYSTGEPMSMLSYEEALEKLNNELKSSENLGTVIHALSSMEFIFNGVTCVFGISASAFVDENTTIDAFVVTPVNKFNVNPVAEMVSLKADLLRHRLASTSWQSKYDKLLSSQKVSPEQIKIREFFKEFSETLEEDNSDELSFISSAQNIFDKNDELAQLFWASIHDLDASKINFTLLASKVVSIVNLKEPFKNKARDVLSQILDKVRDKTSTIKQKVPAWSENLKNKVTRPFEVPKFSWIKRETLPTSRVGQLFSFLRYKSLKLKEFYASRSKTRWQHFISKFKIVSSLCFSSFKLTFFLWNKKRFEETVETETDKVIQFTYGDVKAKISQGDLGKSFTVPRPEEAVIFEVPAEG
jgi:hypothetical protein